MGERCVRVRHQPAVAVDPRPTRWWRSDPERVGDDEVQEFTGRLRRNPEVFRASRDKAISTEKKTRNIRE